MKAVGALGENGTATLITGLWPLALPSLMQRVRTIVSVAAAARQGASPLPGLARTEAHRLVGALGTYGLSGGSELARKAECLLEGDKALDVEVGERIYEVSCLLMAQLERHTPGQSAPAGFC